MQCTVQQLADVVSSATPAHDVLDYLTLGIALLGAITGVAALGATFALFFLSAPRLKVVAGTGLNTTNGIWGITVTATNHGRTAAALDSVGLQLGPDKDDPHSGTTGWTC